jgi:hypothetical protein
MKLTRRPFLKHIASSIAAAVLVMLGRSPTVQAHHQSCHWVYCQGNYGRQCLACGSGGGGPTCTWHDCKPCFDLFTGLFCNVNYFDTGQGCSGPC